MCWNSILTWLLLVSTQGTVSMPWRALKAWWLSVYKLNALFAKNPGTLKQQFTAQLFELRPDLFALHVLHQQQHTLLFHWKNHLQKLTEHPWSYNSRKSNEYTCADCSNQSTGRWWSIWPKNWANLILQELVFRNNQSNYCLIKGMLIMFGSLPVYHLDSIFFFFFVLNRLLLQNKSWILWLWKQVDVKIIIVLFCYSMAVGVNLVGKIMPGKVDHNYYNVSADSVLHITPAQCLFSSVCKMSEVPINIVDILWTVITTPLKNLTVGLTVSCRQLQIGLQPLDIPQ